VNHTISIITAPREPQTLNACITSLRNIRYRDVINIFAEPSENYYCINQPNICFNVHSEKKGAFKNFDYALKWNIQNSSKNIFVIVSDDTIFTEDFNLALTEGMNKHPEAVFACFVLKTMPNINNLCGRTGWNDLSNVGWDFQGGNFAMSKATATKIINHPFYINHLLNYKENQQIDACIAEVCKLMQIPFYAHNNSLTYTIGVISTLGHRSGLSDGLGLR
jgi:hypothetical protein